MKISSINIVGSGAIGLYLYSSLQKYYTTTLFSVRSLNPYSSGSFCLSYGAELYEYSFESHSLSPYDCDLIIYTGLISSFDFNNFSSHNILVCSNMSFFLPPVLKSKFFLSVIENITASLFIENGSINVRAASFSTPKLVSNTPFSLTSSTNLQYQISDYAQRGLLIKGLRTVYYIFYYRRTSGLFSFHTILSELNSLASDSDFCAKCDAVIKKLPDTFYPSILSNSQRQRSELILFLQNFIDFILLNGSCNTPNLLLASKNIIHEQACQ